MRKKTTTVAQKPFQKEMYKVVWATFSRNLSWLKWPSVQTTELHPTIEKPASITLIIIFLCEVNENAKARKHYEQIAKRLDSMSTATARWSRPWQDEQRGDCT